MNKKRVINLSESKLISLIAESVNEYIGLWELEALRLNTVTNAGMNRLICYLTLLIRDISANNSMDYTSLNNSLELMRRSLDVLRNLTISKQELKSLGNKWNGVIPDNSMNFAKEYTGMNGNIGQKINSVVAYGVRVLNLDIVNSQYSFRQFVNRGLSSESPWYTAFNESLACKKQAYAILVQLSQQPAENVHQSHVIEGPKYNQPPVYYNSTDKTGSTQDQ